VSPKKLKPGLLELPFIGHLSKPTGVKPDAEKVQANQAMPIPVRTTRVQKVKAVLKRFPGSNLGSVSSKFTHLLYEECEVLGRLSDKNADWMCAGNTTKKEEFDRVKQLIGDYSLGAALLLDGQPLELSSRTLTSKELN